MMAKCKIQRICLNLGSLLFKAYSKNILKLVIAEIGKKCLLPLRQIVIEFTKH